ncbi:DEAD/DEAH box helicase [Wenyingzhuangia sp. 2_MG-2023]|uniref:DEAD/DEAH box helicase n=1 Tax=Wenyingzhuangia sp. 2_MG-2023 TaxID=3062639 RepID=UPI0026E31616|nr:DEAD/DEAH box helicase [Wenyingzhuangia sp. 2_MG-2023]MDO6737435.1 DEAD/DEAH box helicase [Wenyingzhuangia sp. 2_MG-2023]
MSILPMPFKKLHLDIKEVLQNLEITIPTEFQKASIPVIKSGTNVFCTAPKDQGKTTTLILTTLQKLKCEAVGDIPRALVLVENNEKALALYSSFLTYTRRTSLRVYVANEKEHIDLIKSEIFEGVDILIATPKSISKLLMLYGVNISELKIFNIEDADFLSQTNAYNAILSITQSISKCQYVLYAEKMHPNLKRLESYFMEYSTIVGV